MIMQTNSKKIIKVSAAVLENDRHQILLSSRRLADGRIMWEFPGGKIEAGESAAQAAKRELAEELNLCVYPADTMYVTLYNYPDKTVQLNFVRGFCFDYSGMKMLEAQSVKWVDASAINIDELLEADKDFAVFLKMRTIKN